MFWPNVAKVLKGTVLAQAIPVLSSMVLTRLFLPAEFGAFSVWLGLAQLIAVFMTGRYETAIALEQDVSARLTAVAATARVIGVTALLLAVAGGVLAWSGKAASLHLTGALSVLLAPSAALIAIAQLWQNWAAAEQRFGDLTAIRIIQALGISLAQVLEGLLFPTAVSLAVAYMVGVLTSIAYANHRLPLGATARGARRDFRRRHYRLPLLSLPADTINSAAAQLPLLFIGARFGPESAGLLALTLRTLGAPISILGVSVLDVFRGRAAAAYRDRGECRAEYIDTARGLLIISAIATCVLAWTSRWLFVTAFGAPWAFCGTLTLWLLPMFFLRFIASPMSYTFYIANRQAYDLVWQVALLVTTVGTLLLPPTFLGAVIAWGAGYSALYVVYLVGSYRLSLGRAGR